MTAPQTDRPLADVLADAGRPVDPDGMRRAGADLAARDERRGDRTDLLERIRAAAPATAA